jgi:dipeptidase
MGYNRAKRMWQLLIDRQYDSCMTFARGVSLSYLMSCFRDHGNMSPEDARFSVLGVPEERNQHTICTHGLKGYSTYAYICVCRPDHTDLFSCLWMTFGQPCISPYLPFYIGINAVPEEMRTDAAAKVFDELRLAIEYHPEYRDKITHYWKIFDIHTMEESTELEGKVVQLADSGKTGEARKLLTEFAEKKCGEALSAASQIINDVRGLPRFT